MRLVETIYDLPRCSSRRRRPCPRPRQHAHRAERGRSRRRRPRNLRRRGRVVGAPGHLARASRAPPARAARHPAAAAAAFERAIAVRDTIDRLFRTVAHGRRTPREADLASARRRRGDGAVPGSPGAGRWRLPLELGRATRRSSVRSGPSSMPPSPADRGSARPRQGVRLVSLPVRRREPQPEPPLVLDGRLRHAGQDARLRRATSGGPCDADARRGHRPRAAGPSRPRRGRRAPRARAGGRSRSRAGRACRGCS